MAVKIILTTARLLKGAQPPIKWPREQQKVKLTKATTARKLISLRNEI